MKRTLSFLVAGLAAWGLSLPQQAGAQSGPRTGQVAEQVNALRSAGVTFRNTALFTPVERSAASDVAWQAELAQAQVVRLDRAATATLLAARSEHISMQLPTEQGSWIVDLERVDITTDDFQVTEASTGAAANVAEGLHYRGMVRGVAGSLAAISVFPDEVMGLLSDGDGERVLGRLANDTQGDHVFYREQDLLIPHEATCGTSDVDMGGHEEHLEESGDRTTKCVRFYWEVNYDIFQGKGSVANAANYVTGLFNQSATLYANDGISVLLSEVYVWNVPSPYTSSSTSTQLNTFGTTRTSFNGDLAHLLGYTGGGGVAWLNTICSGQTRYRMAYSDINSIYSNVPTYSWSVEVVTHEQGHNMGSSHTHACVWNGNNTAIDGCGPAAGYSEGGCTAGPVPSSTVGGTIMSYCHLTSAGIKFSNGFGPQPTALIIGRVNNASCLTNCSPVSCNAPTALTASAITTTAATLSWTGASGATSYTLQWKPASGSTWTTVTGVTGTSHALSGLTAGTAYQFQVLTVCSGSSSAYATAVSFTTASPSCGVPSGLESSAITGSSATVAWGAVSGATSYTLQWKPASGSTWTTVTGITGTSRALSGLSAGTAYQFQVLTVCGASSSAYSGVATFTTTAAPCGVPAGLSATAVASSSATLNWAAVSGAVSYTVQWKATSASTWNTVVGVTGTTYGLSGLAAGTAYHFQVSTVCSASSSAYSAAVSFTTAAGSCTDNFEPNGSRSSAPVIGGNTTLVGRIATSSDADWFRFANTSGARNIRVTLTNLPANYRIHLYRGTSLLQSSNASGTQNETIVYNTSTVSTSYYVRVTGSNGAYNSTACYTLNVQVSATAFMPEGMPGVQEEIAEEASPVLRIFPNPADEVVNIQLAPSEGTVRVELLDASGRVVSDTAPASATERIVLNVADRPAGLYFVRIMQGDASTVHRVVIGH